jgi:hypothetical protein
MIERTEHVVAVPNLPERLRGLRVVQLSDLHRSRLTSDWLLREAVSLANAARPDLIVLTGDYVTANPADIEPCAQIVDDLRARLGVFAVLGNHDYFTNGTAVRCALMDAGVTVLTNRNLCLTQGLRIVGIDDDRLGNPDIPAAFAGIPPDAPTLVLLHNPAFAERLADRACVVFSGHTHGGQIFLPFLTTYKLRSIGAKHYRTGWYTVGKTWLYVNRGLGQVGVPIRFRCPPEVAVFTLEPAAPLLCP